MKKTTVAGISEEIANANPFTEEWLVSLVPIYESCIVK